MAIGTGEHHHVAFAALADGALQRHGVADAAIEHGIAIDHPHGHDDGKLHEALQIWLSLSGDSCSL